MNFIEFESAQKIRGGFYTEPSIASYLVRWIATSQPKTLLEPSCGDGAFLKAVEDQRIGSILSIAACELNEEEARKASKRTSLPVQVVNTDFLRWYLFRPQQEERFDAVVGNPPFIRYQYLPKEQQLLAERIFAQVCLPFTKHTNAWVPFVLASLRLLRPGGRLAMVIPSEIFHIPHAQALRQYLVECCSRVLVMDPEEIWFNDTLQGTVLLLAEKKRGRAEKGRGVAVVPMASRQSLLGDPEDTFQRASYTNGAAIEGKWMPLFLSPAERSLIVQLREQENVRTFSEVASVDVGIVTGANKFFLVPDSTVEKYALNQWAHPMFGRSNHVKGLIFSEQDHQDNRDAGLPTNFLWFKEGIEELSNSAREYLGIGQSEKLHTRFKCRTRKSWHTVPSVYSAPISMLKRAHHYPRLVLNSANVLTTDTAYRIQSTGIKPEALVLGFVNSLTCLSAEMEGRHYGGGVLELVPSEIERLLVPLIDVSMAELKSADEEFRNTKDNSEFLHKQDSLILARIGLSRREREILHDAWIRLRDRRHRIRSLDLDTPPMETEDEARLNAS